MSDSFRRNSNLQSGERIKPSTKTDGQMQNHKVTQVNLKEYEFSPPGPMGWTAKEYDKMIDNLQSHKGE